jgi:ribokinase
MSAGVVVIGQLARDLVLVVDAVPDAGNYFARRDPAWGTGELLLPLTRTRVTDTTGAGDAFTATLITALDRGEEPRAAARLAAAAAGATVGHPGGRPDLTGPGLDEQLTLLCSAENDRK